MTGQPRNTVWGALQQVPHTLEFVDADGSATRVLRAGDGPPLVLLHGTGGHLEAYAHNIAGLARHFHVVAYDMLGHGFSDKPDLPYTPEVLSRHLLSLLDALDLGAVHISGESLGGWVAAWTAAHHPERVKGLVLNTPGNVANHPETMQRVKELSLKAASDPTREVIRGRLEWLFKDKSLVTEELIDIRQSIYSQEGYLRATENQVSVQDPQVREPFAWRADWTASIAAPTMLLWTDDDPTASVEDAKVLQDWIPGSSFALIEGAGHWPQWERPEEFERQLITFLRS